MVQTCERISKSGTSDKEDHRGETKVVQTCERISKSSTSDKEDHRENTTWPTDMLREGTKDTC